MTTALPIIVVTLILLGAISWIGYRDRGEPIVSPAVEGVLTRKVEPWVKRHWRILAMVIVLLLAWSAISLLGWNN